MNTASSATVTTDLLKIFSGFVVSDVFVEPCVRAPLPGIQPDIPVLHREIIVTLTRSTDIL